MSLTDVSRIPAETTDARPSHTRAFAEWQMIGGEVHALEERDVPAIRGFMHCGASQIDEAAEHWAARIAQWERDLEAARLTLDYLHARQRQYAAAEHFGRLMKDAAAPELAALKAEAAVTA